MLSGVASFTFLPTRAVDPEEAEFYERRGALGDSRWQLDGSTREGSPSAGMSVFADLSARERLPDAFASWENFGASARDGSQNISDLRRVAESHAASGSTRMTGARRASRFSFGRSRIFQPRHGWPVVGLAFRRRSFVHDLGASPAGPRIPRVNAFKRECSTLLGYRRVSAYDQRAIAACGRANAGARSSCWPTRSH
jgi:hypothetical protein